MSQSVSKLLSEQLKIINEAAKEDVSGYCIILLTNTETDNSFYYSCNGDNPSEVLGVMGIIKNRLESRMATVLDSEQSIESVEDVHRNKNITPITLKSSKNKLND